MGQGRPRFRVLPSCLIPVLPPHRNQTHSVGSTTELPSLHLPCHKGLVISYSVWVTAVLPEPWHPLAPTSTPQYPLHQSFRIASRLCRSWVSMCPTSVVLIDTSIFALHDSCMTLNLYKQERHFPFPGNFRKHGGTQDALVN